VSKFHKLKERALSETSMNDRQSELRDALVCARLKIAELIIQERGRSGWYTTAEDALRAIVDDIDKVIGIQGSYSTPRELTMSKISKHRGRTFNQMVLKAIKKQMKDHREHGIISPPFGNPECGIVLSALDSLSFEDILWGCVNESDLMHIVEQLDMIANEARIDLKAFRDGKQIYPEE